MYYHNPKEVTKAWNREKLEMCLFVRNVCGLTLFENMFVLFDQPREKPSHSTPWRQSPRLALNPDSEVKDILKQSGSKRKTSRHDITSPSKNFALF